MNYWIKNKYKNECKNEYKEWIEDNYNNTLNNNLYIFLIYLKCTLFILQLI